ncbi:hypothetical protein PAEPH01_1015 [Pancytospora epiphaga]|nr:hypothetical protein PAEPH01_1015 [Pancytospora epiphaga]
MDKDKESEFVAYMEYKMHCYKQHRKPLSKNVTGPVVHPDYQIQYGDKKPIENLNEVFGFLSGSEGHISRRSVQEALEKLRIPLKNQLKLFDLIGTEFIDLDEFYRIFG